MIILGSLQASLGADQHCEAPDRLGVQGLCEAAQVWRLSVQMQAAEEGGVGKDGDHDAAAESESGLSRAGLVISLIAKDLMTKSDPGVPLRIWLKQGKENG